jgi:hypothetical protein
VTSRVLFRIVKFIEDALRPRVTAQRFAKRRVAVAYHWLDMHRLFISQELLVRAIQYAQMKVDMEREKKVG